MVPSDTARASARTATYTTDEMGRTRQAIEGGERPEDRVGRTVLLRRRASTTAPPASASTILWVAAGSFGLAPSGAAHALQCCGVFR